jgi:hypothetical protein
MNDISVVIVLAIVSLFVIINDQKGYLKRKFTAWWSAIDEKKHNVIVDKLEHLFVIFLGLSVLMLIAGIFVFFDVSHEEFRTGIYIAVYFVSGFFLVPLVFVAIFVFDSFLG